MAIAKKGKRLLIREGRSFYWYMKETEDWMHAYVGPQLHILSEDKHFLISYQPGQQTKNPFLIVKGEEFNGIEVCGGVWKRVKVPNWDDTTITPGFVRRLIDWCFAEKHQLVIVNYLGEVID